MIFFSQYGTEHIKIATAPNNYQIIHRTMLNFGRSGNRFIIRNAVTNGTMFNLQVTDIEQFKGNIDEVEKQLLAFFYGENKAEVAEVAEVEQVKDGTVK